jgi:hypothetical protein
MRTIDLILLLNDFKKNNRIFVEDGDQRLAVVDIEIIDDSIVLKTSNKLHGLKNWEFLVLLNKKIITNSQFFTITKTATNNSLVSESLMTVYYLVNLFA